MDKTLRQHAPGCWSCRSSLIVAFSADHPADDGGQLLGAGHLRPRPARLRRRRVVRAGAERRRLHGRFPAPAGLLRSVLLIEIPLGIALALAMPVKGWQSSLCLVLVALPLLIPWNVVGTIWQIFARGDIGLAGCRINSLGIAYNYTASAATPGSPCWSWTSGTGRRWSPCSATPACASIPDAYYQAAHDRRRLGLGDVPLHPAAQAARRADHRRSCCASWTAS